MAESIPIERIEKRIYLIQGRKVMLAQDLAELYGVPVKRLNEQVKRNIKRFPLDFMIHLTFKEFSDLKSQFATSSWGGVRKLPNAFTENGVAMLSSVLNSERAVQVNIQIMRTFTRLREMQETQKHMFAQINRHEVKLLQHDRQIAEVFRALDGMQEIREVPRKRKMGFISPEK